MIKTLSKQGIEGDFLYFIKNIYKRATDNITLNGEELKAFLGRLGSRQRSLPPFLFSIALQVPAKAGKRNKSCTDWEERNKIVFAHR